MAQNAPKEGNPVLADRQLERLVRAVIVGYEGQPVPQRKLEEAVRWAEAAMVNADMLGRLFDGRLALRKHRGEWEFRDTTPEEARYILDADGKVERE